MRKLTKEQIDFLLSKNFEQNDKKHSGYYFIDDDRTTKVLIPLEDSFRLEFYELCDDGDGNYYTDYDKEYSSETNFRTIY